jgi:hypothetical protein
MVQFVYFIRMKKVRVIMNKKRLVGNWHLIIS